MAALATCVLTLVSCGSSTPQGTGPGKEHEAAHTTWSTVPTKKRVCTWTTRRVGKKTSRVQSCSTVSAGTRQVAHTTPECWELELDTGDEVCVSAHTWRTTAVGDKY